MKTLHLDQARKTGWAVFADGRPVAAGDWHFRARLTPGDLAKRIADNVAACVIAQGINAVTIEDVNTVRFANRNNNVALYLAKLRGALESELRTVLLMPVCPLTVQDVAKVRKGLGLQTNAAFIKFATHALPPGPHTADAATALAHGAYFWAKRAGAEGGQP